MEGDFVLKLNTRDMILTALFTALMIVGAMVKILLPTVPMSLQTFFCALAGIILGARLAMLSQIIYVLIGLAGVPVFTQGGGPMYIFNPTFGYLLGFIISAYIIGKLSENYKNINFTKALFSLLCGLFSLYLVGTTYLYFIVKYYVGNVEMTISSAIAVGVLPFIIKDIILYVLVSFVAVKVKAVFDKQKKIF